MDFKSGIFVESKSGMLLDVSDPWIGLKHDPWTHCMFRFVQQWNWEYGIHHDMIEDGEAAAMCRELGKTPRGIYADGFALVPIP